RERRARALLRLDPDLAAQEPRDLAADREAEAGAAEAARGRAVRLLERLEDQAQLVVRNPDPRVRDGEREHLLRRLERRARVVEIVRRDADPQADLTRLGELDRVRQQVIP